MCDGLWWFHEDPVMMCGGSWWFHEDPVMMCGGSWWFHDDPVMMCGGSWWFHEDPVSVEHPAPVPGGGWVPQVLLLPELLHSWLSWSGLPGHQHAKLLCSQPSPEAPVCSAIPVKREQLGITCADVLAPPPHPHPHLSPLCSTAHPWGSCSLLALSSTRCLSPQHPAAPPRCSSSIQVRGATGRAGIDPTGGISLWITGCGAATSQPSLAASVQGDCLGWECHRE